jgi:diacylglycerol kinase family enzyme
MARRVAAMAALTALLVAVVFLLVGIVVHVAAVILALVTLLICSTSGWYVVSRRGVVRVVAAIVVLIAAAAFGTGLAFADISVWRAALVIALGVVSVLAARYALRRTRRQLLARSAHLVRAERPAHPVLIINPKSGGGKGERFQLAQVCRQRGIEAVVLRPGDDLLQLAEDAVARGADVIGMAGGDGSQALVASVAARHDIPHVCVPAGTRNHFALDLGLNRNDVVGALDAFADGVERRIDLATVNGRTFVNNASLGLYAEVVQSPEYRDAKLKTAAAILPDLLGPDATQLDLSYTGPDGAAHHTAHLILVSNNPYQLQHLGGRGTRPRLNGGVLGIVAVMIADAADAGRFAALEAAGRVSQFPGWTEWNAPRFEISSDGPVQIGVDGEALTMDSPVVFASSPGALRVRLPRHALKVSPAARTVHVLSRSTIAELGRVVAGRADPDHGDPALAGAEQAGAEQAGAEQAGAEQAGAEQAGAEQADADRADADRAGSRQAGARQAGRG